MKTFDMTDSTTTESAAHQPFYKHRSFVVAAVVAIVAFVVGLGPIRRWMHERTAPSWLSSGPVYNTVAAHRRAFQWGVLVLGLVVLVLWNQPTVLAALIIVLVTLFVVMLIGLFGAKRRATAAPPAGPGPAAGAVGP